MQNRMKGLSGSEKHVNFDNKNFLLGENEIIITQSGPGRVQVHLGFLQYHHKYSVSFKIPKNYCLSGPLNNFQEILPSIICKLCSVKQENDEVEVVIEFHAEKERLVKEEFNLCLGDSNVVIEFIARVLGLGKGTPLLRNGIKCIGVNEDEQSEASDWQD